MAPGCEFRPGPARPLGLIEPYRHIFLELCTGGDLFTYITSHAKPAGYLCEGEAKYIMFQVFKALKYLHDRMISHRGGFLEAVS